MHPEGHADRLIEKALEDGTLDTGDSHGKPLPTMDNDPLWWVKGLLDRESRSERQPEVQRLVDDLLESATNQPDLQVARRVLAERNALVDEWNAGAPEDMRMEVVEEVDLLARRAEAPGR